ncbi:aminotransferase class III-fold pyridoxal phosphate-dependent enzyme [Ruegeria arenilitoris]|uniref:aminotransferase class III-fold pyridoxal phosphate-dependent enzyme n=1 Tax=Ruegeria arenilitoris TaxID=1173585 RepID=UPI0014802E4A|nr:aminotransferase class III-fold pyridoxal phosphate-dependent enzyme [Ruegeria arenilitoris]
MYKLHDITAIEAATRSHLIQPWESISTLGEIVRPVITGSKNIYVLGDQGRKLIDGPAGMWCSQIGCGRKNIAEAMAAQAMHLSYNSPWYTTSSPAAHLAEKIANVTPGDLNHVFLTSGGSTAVDAALRLVQLYQNVRGKTDKNIVLARTGGYHGSTHLSAAMSGSPASRRNFDVDREPVSFLTEPNRLNLPAGVTEEGFCEFLLLELRNRIAELGADKIAAFIAEPVQASGGVIVPPDGYLKEVRQICRENDILYIPEEVVTAFGLCGAWFASEEVFGITPDTITFAKGVTSGYVPLVGFAVSDRILNEIAAAVYSNGYTYSGHPVACETGPKSMDILESEEILEHVRDIAPYFKSKLSQLKDMEIVKDVRAVGLLGAVECEVPGQPDIAIGAEIDRHCVELGLIVRPGRNMCVMSPPLIITRDQIDDMVGILREGILRASANHPN